MPDIPSSEPSYVWAGTTIQWTKSFDDYPSDEWTLKYQLSYGSNQLVLTGTQYGTTTDHLIQVAAATSQTWTHGPYTWALYAEQGTGPTLSRYFLSSGALTVKSFTGRSHVKEVLDAIEALLEGRAGADVDSYSIQGRSIAKMRIEELLKWRSHYKAEYQAELDAERVAQGLESSRRVGVRFNRI